MSEKPLLDKELNIDAACGSFKFWLAIVLFTSAGGAGGTFVSLPDRISGTRS
jgi:hypothetical protein